MHHDKNHNNIDDSMIAIVVVEIETNSYNNNDDNNNIETSSNRSSSITRVKVRINESHLVKTISTVLLSTTTPNHNNESSSDNSKINLSNHDNNNKDKKVEEEDINFFLSSIQLKNILKHELQLLFKSNNNDIKILFTEGYIIDNNEEEEANNNGNFKQQIDDTRYNKTNDFSTNSNDDDLIHNKMMIIQKQEIFIPHLQSYIEWNDIPISWNLLKYIGTRIRVRINMIEMNHHHCKHQHQQQDTTTMNDNNNFKLICGRYYNWDGNGIYDNGSSYQILSVIDLCDCSYHLEFQELSNQSNSMNDNNGSTGNNIWDGSVLMTRYLEAIVRYVPSVQPYNSNHYDYQYHNNTNDITNILLHHHNVENMNLIIEFGSGCGVSGICAKALGGSNVILTDLSNVLNLLKLNIKRNEYIINQKQKQQQQIQNQNTELVQKEKEQKINSFNPSNTTTTIPSFNNIEQEDVSDMICCECDWTKPISNTLLKYLKYYAILSSSLSTSEKQQRKTPTISTTPTDNTIPIQNNNSINNNNGTILILIADCIWMEHLVYPLLNTVQQTMEILWMENDNNLHINVLITYQRRGKGTDDIFWKYLYEIFSQYGYIHIIDDAFLHLIGMNHKPNVFSIISCCCAKNEKHDS